MVFCNTQLILKQAPINEVTILILIDGFLQSGAVKMIGYSDHGVTILILIDGFLQYKYNDRKNKSDSSHNPYFNRWFSAILK